MTTSVLSPQTQPQSPSSLRMITPESACWQIGDVTTFHKEHHLTLPFPRNHACSKCGTRFWAPSPAFQGPSLTVFL